MFCRSCGKELLGSPEICPNCGAKPMNATNFCPNCGAPMTSLTEVCVKCGVRPSKVARSHTWKPTVAGILDIVAGSIGMAAGIGILFYPGPIEVVFFCFSIIAIIGGLCALGRRVWGLALAGAISALWPTLWPATLILGILAIILTATSRQEFK